MAKYIKRIRYRRRRVYRPYAFLFKAPINLASSIKPKVKQPAMQDKVDAHEQTPAIELAESVQDITAELHYKQQPSIDIYQEDEPGNEPLAYFEKGQDPYAYLVSQLPLMLNSIPNLLYEPNVDEKKSESSADNHDLVQETITNPTSNNRKINKLELTELKAKVTIEDKPHINKVNKLELTEPKAKRTIENKPRILCSSRQLSDHFSLNETYENTKKNIGVQEEWLQWSKSIKPIKTQSNLLLDCLIPSHKAQAFPWLGVIKSSFKQTHYKTHCAKITEVIQNDLQQTLFSPEYSFLHVEVLTIARAQELTLAELLIKLSSAPVIAKTLARGQLSCVSQVFFSLPKQLFNQLNVITFLNKATKKQLLTPKANWFDCLLVKLVASQKTRLTLKDLPKYFSKAPTECLFKLRTGTLSCYVEISTAQVCLSYGKAKPFIISKTEFINHLISSLSSELNKPSKLNQINTIIDEPIYLSVYRINFESKKKLLTQLKNQLKQGGYAWEMQEKTSFNCFLSKYS